MHRSCSHPWPGYRVRPATAAGVVFAAAVAADVARSVADAIAAAAAAATAAGPEHAVTGLA
eukprot:8357130-Alexandrium_andersonii.AAC.1